MKNTSVFYLLVLKANSPFRSFCFAILQETLKGSGTRVLHLAVYLQNAEIVTDILDAGADPNLVATFTTHNIPGLHISPFEHAVPKHPLDIQASTSFVCGIVADQECADKHTVLFFAALSTKGESHPARLTVL